MSLDLEQLRRFTVARNFFKPTTLKRALHKMEFVQADPIRAPARAQDLILRHRVKDYRAGDLERRYSSLDIEEEVFVNYGYVDDIIIKDGQISAVAVRPDVTWGAPGLHAYPYYGYGYGWYPGYAYYDLPYERADVEGLEPLDEEAWDD